MINLIRVDSVPLTAENFSSEFDKWLSVTVDEINESLQIIQDNLNQVNASIVSINNLLLPGLVAPSYTGAQIITLSATAPDGTIWYSTDTDQFIGKANGVLIVIA